MKTDESRTSIHFLTQGIGIHLGALAIVALFFAALDQFLVALLPCAQFLLVLFAHLLRLVGIRHGHIPRLLEYTAPSAHLVLLPLFWSQDSHAFASNPTASLQT